MKWEPINYSALGKKYGVHPMIVSRMTKGTARLDGKGKGRRTLLSETTEGNLLLVLQLVIYEGRIPVTYSVVKALAEIEW